VTRSRRFILAGGIALLCGAPALLEAPWQSAFSPLVFAINMPGILLTLPHLPPEGIPAQSPSQAVLMLLAQVVVWFIIFSLVRAIRLRRTWIEARQAHEVDFPVVPARMMATI